MPSSHLLHATGLAAERDGRCLFRALSLRVDAGEILRVEGPNGAGKTTLLRMLAGLDQDHEGSITWPAAAAAGRPWREDVLFLGHLSGLKGALTARENLAWLAALRGSVAQEFSSRASASRESSLNQQSQHMDVSAALAHVGLAGYEDVPVSALSAGQKRRVALARLHCEKAPLWILDEPFTAIDRAGVAALEKTLEEHARNGGAVIVTTHHALAIEARSLTLLAVEAEA